jgi:thiol-disulfide isomerase/thioredoxin
MSNSDHAAPVTSKSTDPLELVNAQQKREILSKYPMVVVLVYASWCGPCQSFKPEYASFARQNVSKAFFAKENLELRLSTNEGVRGVPTLLVYKSGRLIKQIVGGDLGALNEVLPPI